MFILQEAGQAPAQEAVYTQELLTKHNNNLPPTSIKRPQTGRLDEAVPPAVGAQTPYLDTERLFFFPFKSLTHMYPAHRESVSP